MEQLFAASKEGDVKKVVDILDNHHDVNINWKNEQEFGYTALHQACLHGHDKIVALLLQHKPCSDNHTSHSSLASCSTCLDVNVGDQWGYTPFS